MHTVSRLFRSTQNPGWHIAESFCVDSFRGRMALSVVSFTSVYFSVSLDVPVNRYHWLPFSPLFYARRYHEAVWAAEDGSLPHALTAAPVGMSSILAALLALGALFERKVEDSERLYRAARQSYLDIIDLATLESIQLALQLAVFEINTSRSKSVWSSLAVAVRLSHYLVCNVLCSR